MPVGGENKLIETTTGRIIFNQIVPKELGYINKVLTKKESKDLIATCFKKVGNVRTVQFLDDIKDLGFGYAMRGGLSVGLIDAIIPAEKEPVITEAQKEVDKISAQYQNGFISGNEKYNQTIDVWQKATNKIAEAALNTLKSDKGGFNVLYMMLDSGARGSKDQVKQLTGMKGLISRPQKSMSGQPGEIIENPITSNLREGLTVLEYFISTHGARKGLSDTSLKTADAGYLTRRLHDVAQDAIITETDCGTVQGIKYFRKEEEESQQIKFHERLIGRVSVHDIEDPVSGDVIVAAGELVSEEAAERIGKSGINEVEIRSVLTCETKRGVCSRCYGTNLATGRLIEVGEAVGVIASQSIGEPGTQLTLRTFHQGGAAQGANAESEIRAKFDGVVEFDNLKLIDTTEVNEEGEEEKVTLVANRNGSISISDKENNKILKKYDVPYGARLGVKDKEKVFASKTVLYSSEPNATPIISEYDGEVKFIDIEKGVTYQEETDEQTGHMQKVIIQWRGKTKATDTREPKIVILNKDKEVKVTFSVPIKANLLVENGQKIKRGQILVKIPRDTGRVGGDITAGLPRVTELFEARNPAEPAVVTEIDGTVKFGGQKRNNREVIITNPDGTSKIYLVPIGKHVLVQEGDYVKAGDKITDGAISPQDILNIKGPNEVQQYLVGEIQKVYQINAGVEINDKHLEVIVRQMLQKVIVENAGDTLLLEGDMIDKWHFKQANEAIGNRCRITHKGDALDKKVKVGVMLDKADVAKINKSLKKDGKDLVKFDEATPATGSPVLLGITNAALLTDSFISAASFQETTKVLTDAAVEGKADHLLGLKENVIVGKLIPAGTGLRKYRNLQLSTEELKKKEIAKEAVVAEETED
jgi:DNA-directed RNA polymerase subunit beta'